MTRTCPLLLLLVTLLSSTLVYAQAARSPVELVKESRSALAAGEMARARSLADRAVDADPAYAAAWKAQGAAALRQGEASTALEALETARDLDPEDPEIGSLLAAAARGQAGDHIPALDDTAVSDLIYSLLDSDRNTEAAEIAANWGRGRSAAEVRAARAAEQVSKGELTAARATLRQAEADTRGAPLRAVAWAELGHVELERGRATQAIAAYRKALALRPGWSPALRELGWAYKAARKPAQAADTWEEGIRVDPSRTTWWLWVAEARVSARDNERALAALDRLLAARPDHERGRAQKLALLLAKEDPSEAEDYEQKVRKTPDGDWAVLQGQVLADRRRGRFSNATQRLTPRVRDGDTRARELLIDTYADWARRVKTEDSVVPLERLSKLVPGRSTVWRDLGWAYWAAGEKEKASAAWNRAILGGLSRRQQLELQVVAQLAEEGEGERAVVLYRLWNPKRPLLPFAERLLAAKRRAGARAVMQAAWENGENPRKTGLALAMLETRAGRCEGLPLWVAPVMHDDLAALPLEDLDALFEALAACSDDPAALPLIDEVLAQLRDSPAHRERLADLTERAARAREEEGDYERAFALQVRSLDLDPTRERSWMHALVLGQQVGQLDSLRALNERLRFEGSAVVRSNAEGFREESAGRPGAAIAHYRKSLDLAPYQPELRERLFDLLVAAGENDAARAQLAWFEARWEEGNSEVATQLAELYTAVGEGPKARALWDDLYLEDPGNAYYAVETAQSKFEECRAEEATELLTDFVSLRPNANAYALLAEIAVATGRMREALDWTAAGLELGPSERLLRLKAEAAEGLADWTEARRAAEAVLERDPGDVYMARLAGRAAQFEGHPEEAKQHWEALLARNPLFLPSLVNLQLIAVAEGDQDRAVELATRVREQRPWDDQARRRYALALAEAKRFRPALQAIREDAGRRVTDAVPILLYRDVSICGYVRRNDVAQLSAHLGRLAAEDIHLIGPDEAVGPSAEPRAMVVVERPRREVVVTVDGILQESGGVVIQVPGERDLAARAAVPTDAEPQRWITAASGPYGSLRVPVNGAGWRGNPLTHRVFFPDRAEDLAAMEQRLSRALEESAALLGRQRPRVLVYPRGDDGAFSLDTDPPAVDVLQRVVEEHFDFAITGSATGFATPPVSPRSLPALTVPPDWDSGQLARHLREEHPLTQSTLLLGKLLAWSGQHESADPWFRRAEELGAEPTDVLYHWGVNSSGAGDRPSALARLRRAAELDPASERIGVALAKVENEGRPHLGGVAGGWDDDDDRSYRRFGGGLSGYLADPVKMNFEVWRESWDRDDVGKEWGTRIQGGGRWHFVEEWWADAELFWLRMDDVDDLWGGKLLAHAPVRFWNGSFDASVEKLVIDTVEAVSDDTTAVRIRGTARSRVLDEWDLLFDLWSDIRNDDNDTIFFEGRIERRIPQLWDFIVGYRVILADSDEDPPEYWAPEGLNQHQITIGHRGEVGNLFWNVGSEIGIADESGTNIRFVWGGRVRVGYTAWDRTQISVDVSRLETPDYSLNRVFLNGTYRF